MQAWWNSRCSLECFFSFPDSQDEPRPPKKPKLARPRKPITERIICDQCGTSVLKNNFKHHLGTHEILFSCDQCGKVSQKFLCVLWVLINISYILRVFPPNLGWSPTSSMHTILTSHTCVTTQTVSHGSILFQIWGRTKWVTRKSEGFVVSLATRATSIMGDSKSTLMPVTQRKSSFLVLCVPWSLILALTSKGKLYNFLYSAFHLTSSFSFSRHIIKVHNIDKDDAEEMTKLEKKPKEKIRVICDLCSKSYKNKHDLHLHKNAAHTHEIKFPCDRCPKVFYRKNHLKR